MFGLDDRITFALLFGAGGALFLLIVVARRRPDHRQRRANTGSPRSKRPLWKRIWRRLMGG